MRTSGILTAAASVILALAPGARPLPAQGGDTPGVPWPFGKSGRGAMDEKDDFNLGLLGAKARDADREPAQRKGGRIAAAANGDRKDQGPVRLLVEILFPEGPAAKAGLLIGDVITGVNGRSFENGSLGPVAVALTKAEAAAKGVVTLDVQREGKKGKEKVAIKVPVKSGGADAAEPTAPKGRRAILEGACDWLAARQVDDGGFPQTLSGTNGAVVQASLAGLAWLAHGGGKYAPNIEKSVKFVMRYLDEPDRMGSRGGANWNQSNWGYVHAAIFLGELQVRKPSALVKRELQRIAEEIGKRQEASGGWAHGPGGPNALNYLELNIVTSLAISALGSAKVAGCQVDEKVVDRAMAYLEASGGGDGGVGYSTEPGQKGQGNIGRTAASWLGAENLGLGKAVFVTKMQRYVAQWAGEVLGGHASLMQHILLAGVAAQAVGGTTAREYWSKLERDLVLARAPDGSLQPRPWHESLSMGSNSDVTFGEVWTTAAWAIVLGADPKDNKPGGLPVWTGAARAAKR